MKEQSPASFDNTEIAFAAKSDKELKKAHFLFSAMGKGWIVKMGTRLTPLAIKWHIPFTRMVIRNTIAQQFVGGETLEETAGVASKLARFNVQVILDYGVEGKESEADFEHARDVFCNAIGYASRQPNIPFMSVKVTGYGRFALLETVDTEMKKQTGTLMKRYLSAVEKLSPEDKEEFHRIRLRLMQVCSEAARQNVGVLIDAEETWIQEPVDALTILMMDTFNKGKAVVYNTLQMYRHDRLAFLNDSLSAARERDFILGTKLVRGAYMDKERNRALEKGYPSPIQPDKAATDRDFNAAVEFCVDHLDQVALIVATHNEYSNAYTTELLGKKGLPHNHPHVHFSQLYGMSDNITFNLARSGCSVSKYLPFGPIKDVIPYLMRRAQENSSVSGQTGRELALIKKEISRRGI